MARLNKKAPYGSITGELESHPGALYEQDGKFFNMNGIEILKGGKLNDTKGSVTDEPPDDSVGKVTQIGASAVNKNETPESSDEEIEIMTALLENGVNEIKAKFPELTTEQMETLQRVETNGMARSTLLQAIDKELNSRKAA